MKPSSRPYKHRHPLHAVFLPFLGVLLLSACQDGAPPDLQPWLAQVRSQARPTPLPEMPLPAVPARWSPEPDTADPFGLGLMVPPAHAADPAAAAPRHAAAPASAPLIRAVAILRRAGASRALLQIGARMLQVVPGDVLPGMSGRVLSIDDRAVRLELAGREIRIELGIGDVTTNESNGTLAGGPA